MSVRSDRAPLPPSLLPAALDQTSDAVIVVDRSASIRFLNRGAEAMFALSADDALGSSLAIFLPNDEPDGYARLLAELDDGDPVRTLGEDGRLWARRADGRKFAAEASVCRVAADGATFFVAVVRDVTDRVELLERESTARRRAEAAERRASFLVTASEALSDTLDHDRTIEAVARAPVPTLADWSVVYLSERGEDPRRVEVTHRDDEQRAFLRSVLHELPVDSEALDPVRYVMERGVPARLSDVLSLAWRGLATSGRGEQLEGVLRGHYGLLVPLLLRGEPIGALFLFRAREAGWHRFDTDEIELVNDLARHAALAIDNARLHRQARDMTRLRDEILGVVSHDLRNPINIISMTVSLMREIELPPEERDRRLAVIQRTTESMNRLVGDLLEVSRIESGRLGLDLSAWDPALLVDKAYQTYGVLAARKSLNLERDAAGGLPPVIADVERISQVFGNLIGNAIKFTPEGGSVTIGAARADDAVEFRVEDTGPGIDPEDVAHVFDRFWQARHHRRSGAGLGLAIVKGIVEAHGGVAGVRSEPGRGSTFWFTLPSDRRSED